MKTHLRRRSFLGGLIAVSSGAMVFGLSPAHAAASRTDSRTSLSSRHVIWDARVKRWPPRPTEVETGVLYFSTDDPDAPVPEDFDVQHGDAWWRHPRSSHRVALDTTGGS